MDFRKILFIFLGMFITLDIFLVYAWNQTQQAVTAPASALDIVNEMQNDGITVPLLASDKHTGSYVSAQADNSVLLDERTSLDSSWTVRVNNGLLRANLDQLIKLGNSKAKQIASLEKLAKRKSMVIKGDEYDYDSIATRQAGKQANGNKVIVFSQKVFDGKLFNSDLSEIRFSINDQGELVSYTQRYLAKKTQLRDPSELTTEIKAVTVVYQYNEIANNQKILDTNLVYSELTQVDGDIIYVPSWQISVQDTSGKVREQYVNALNGTLLK